LFEELKEFVCLYDDSGSIGKRYSRLDAIGTPFCITIDGDSLKNDDVTIRERDWGKQKRVKIKDLKNLLKELLNEEKRFGEI